MPSNEEKFIVKTENLNQNCNEKKDGKGFKMFFVYFHKNSLFDDEFYGAVVAAEDFGVNCSAFKPFVEPL